MSIKNGDKVSWVEEGIRYHGTVKIEGDEVCLINMAGLFPMLRPTAILSKEEE